MEAGKNISIAHTWVVTSLGAGIIALIQLKGTIYERTL